MNIMLLFRVCNSQKLLQRLLLVFRQFHHIFIFTQIYAAVSTTHCFHSVLLRQCSNVP